MTKYTASTGMALVGAAGQCDFQRYMQMRKMADPSSHEGSANNELLKITCYPANFPAELKKKGVIPTEEPKKSVHSKHLAI